MERKSYKMKPHALNAAKKLGLGPEAVAKDEYGWFVKDSGTLLAQEAAQRLADQTIREHAQGLEQCLPKTPVAMPAEKQVADPIATGVAFPDRKAPVPANPVAFIRHTLNSQRFGSRKLAIAYLVENGINIHTAKTQYQRWHAGDL